ncbi:SDR family NAD(P)-dependent oxidoreductase [Ilumatobacter sp.]|uniref:SDR family NAD(P)-dependent oxidoreductase n=1 Tax=Ilumatobacter sp. TaxID=1967498 RepID=UPI003AF9A770
MFRLDGKVALITGSTRGLGRAMAEAMIAQGAHVVINGRSDDAVLAVAAELDLDGRSASGVAFDVADLSAGDAAIDTIVGRHGAIDILVNNAGINRRAAVEDFGDDEWRDVLAVNLDAPFALSRSAGRHMTAAGRGRIINTASIMGTVARPTIPAYVTSKAGLVGMTKALAVEMAPHGLTVNAIGPGYVATEMNTALVQDPEFNSMVVDSTPVGRWGTPQEIAAAAVFLASDEASYVNGQTLLVDGGMTTAL